MAGVVAGDTGHVAAHNNRGIDVTLPPYDAAGDGSTLDDSAIAAAIADLEDGMGLVFPYDKAFKVSQSMVFTGLQRVHVDARGARFVWAGNASTPLVHIKGCRNSEWEGGYLTSNPSVPLAEGFRVESEAGYVTTRLTFRNVIVQGTTPAGLDYGWRFISGSAGDNNNDLHHLNNCSVRNSSEAAFSQEASQQHAILYERCNWSGSGSKYGITTALGTGGQGGYFEAKGCGGGACSVADYYVGAPNHVINIIGHNSELSARLLETVSASSNPWPINIIGGRFAVGSSDIHTDKRIINYTQRGPLNLFGFTVSGDVEPVTFYFNPNGEGVATAIGNQILTSAADPFEGKWSMTAANIINDGTARTALEALRVGSPYGGIGFFGAAATSQPSANPDTSGATLGQLETEVNEIKQALRDLGLIAT